MKSAASALIAGLLLAITSSVTVASHDTQESLEKRVAKIGNVTVMTEEEAKAAAEQAQATAQASSGPADGESIYGAYCGACHTSGVGGAPIVGDAGVWAARLDKGLETLIENAINGIQGDAGVMPARGGSNASDEEMAAAVKYMIEASQ